MEATQQQTNPNFKNVVRQTAYHAWIGDLINGVFIKSRGDFDPSYVAVRGLNISRVNLIGVVISSQFQDGYASLVLDDGSGAISIRVWREDIIKLDGLETGNLVMVVGKIRSFNNSVYVIPDFIRKLDNTNWMKCRKIELEKKFGKFVKVENSIKEPLVESYIPDEDLEAGDMEFLNAQEETVSNVISERVEDVGDGIGSKRSMLISLIEKEDNGEGADIALIISKSGLSDDEAQKVIDELIKGGEIFEVRPGFVRALV